MFDFKLIELGLPLKCHNSVPLSFLSLLPQQLSVPLYLLLAILTWNLKFTSLFGMGQLLDSVLIVCLGLQQLRLELERVCFFKFGQLRLQCLVFDCVKIGLDRVRVPAILVLLQPFDFLNKKCTFILDISQLSLKFCILKCLFPQLVILPHEILNLRSVRMEMSVSLFLDQSGVTLLGLQSGTQRLNPLRQFPDGVLVLVDMLSRLSAALDPFLLKPVDKFVELFDLFLPVPDLPAGILSLHVLPQQLLLQLDVLPMQILHAMTGIFKLSDQPRFFLAVDDVLDVHIALDMLQTEVRSRHFASAFKLIVVLP
jgi:hypothetical protein